MITWGISANSHDSALAVFEDNKLVFASHSERFSGKKNDRDLCDSLVEYATQWGNPSKIYWYENPYKKTARQLLAGQGWNWRDNNIKTYLAKYGISAPISYTGHHHSHAAAGYYTSGYDDACVIVLDAIGEFNTYSIWDGSRLSLTNVIVQDYPNSLGLFYSAMTQRCYLKPNEDEYILMGMAAYGDPNRLLPSMLEDLISVDTMDSPFILKRNLHRGCQGWRPDLNIKDVFDIAAATQRIYEIAFDRVLQQAKRLTSSKNLVLMGGCALNCSANVATGKYFDQTWIMPNPGDAGSAVGAVLAKNPSWKIAPSEFTPFIGYDMGSSATNEVIVDWLVEHKMCGIARGKAEYGPRAFGNRSLVADPRGSDIKDVVNNIKQRQQFRPFAPAILEELVHEYFEMPLGWDNSRYMQVVARCKYPEKYPAIIHKDGTSRVQTVPNDNSPFRKLLELWYAKTGCPMLLNTSLNIKGQPMVNNHDDASNFSNCYNIVVFN
jgi:carbamoyltransferase